MPHMPCALPSVFFIPCFLSLTNLDYQTMATLPELSTSHANGETQANSAPVGLKVIIAGGGIGGFTAAIALRQQGHDVEVCLVIQSQPKPIF